jgi:hypothetical protein
VGLLKLLDQIGARVVAPVEDMQLALGVGLSGECGHGERDDADDEFVLHDEILAEENRGGGSPPRKKIMYMDVKITQ